MPNKPRPSSSAVSMQVQDRRLTQNQYDALTSATFNTGRADNHQILDAANRHDDAAVAEHMRNTVFTHNHDGHGNPIGPAVRSQGLVNRRNDEIRQYGQP
jgi:GH24 family phage-related lysozyme (muramidase)